MYITEMKILYGLKESEGEEVVRLFVDALYIYCNGDDARDECIYVLKQISPEAEVLTGKKNFDAPRDEDSEIPIISIIDVDTKSNYRCFLVKIWGIYAQYSVDQSILFEFFRDFKDKTSCHRLDIKLWSGLCPRRNDGCMFEEDLPLHADFIVKQGSPLIHKEILDLTNLLRSPTGVTSYFGSIHHKDVSFRTVSGIKTRYYELQVHKGSAKKFNKSLRDVNQSLFFYEVYKAFLFFTSEIVRIPLTEPFFERQNEIQDIRDYYLGCQKDSLGLLWQKQNREKVLKACGFSKDIILFSNKITVYNLSENRDIFQTILGVYMLFFTQKINTLPPPYYESTLVYLDSFWRNKEFILPTSVPATVKQELSFNLSSLLSVLGLDSRKINYVRIINNLELLATKNIVYKTLGEDGQLISLDSKNILYDIIIVRRTGTKEFDYKFSGTLNIRVFSDFLTDCCSMPVGTLNLFHTHVKKGKKKRNVSNSIYLLFFEVYREIFLKRKSINVNNYKTIYPRADSFVQMVEHIIIILEFLQTPSGFNGFSSEENEPPFADGCLKYENNLIEKLSAKKREKEVLIYLYYY